MYNLKLSINVIYNKTTILPAVGIQIFQSNERTAQIRIVHFKKSEFKTPTTS